MEVRFVKVNQLVIVIFIINLFVQTISFNSTDIIYSFTFPFSIFSILSIQYLNIFITLFLVIIMLLTKLPCFIKFFIFSFHFHFSFSFLFFALILCLCVNVLHVFYLFTNFNDYNSSIGSTFFHIHPNIQRC